MQSSTCCTFLSRSDLFFYYVALWKPLIHQIMHLTKYKNYTLLINLITKNINLFPVRCPEFYRSPLGFFHHVFGALLQHLCISVTVLNSVFRLLLLSCHNFLRCCITGLSLLCHQLQLWRSFSVINNWWYNVKGWLLIQRV